MKEQRREWVDAIKGIAIIGVVVIHSGFEQVLPKVFNAVASIGDKGVQIFYIISAYLLYLSYDRFEKTGQKYFCWIKKKWLRLAPLYYIALAVSLLTIGGFPSWLGDLKEISIWNVLAHVFFVHGFYPPYVNSILGVEWYLGNYALMVVIMPFIYRKVNSLSRATALFAGSSVLCYFITYGASFINPISNEQLWQTYIDSFWFPTQFPVMAIGFVLYFIICKLQEYYKGKENKLLSYTLLGMSCYSVLILIAGVSYKGLSIYIVWSIVILGLIISQVMHKSPLIINPFFITLGKNSYVIYLFHRIIFRIYEKFLGEYYDSSIMAWGIRLLVVFLVSLILSGLVTRLSRMKKKS